MQKSATYLPSALNPGGPGDLPRGTLSEGVTGSLGRDEPASACKAFQHISRQRFQDGVVFDTARLSVLSFSRISIFRFALSHQLRGNQLSANTFSLPDRILAKWKNGSNQRDNQHKDLLLYARQPCQWLSKVVVLQAVSPSDCVAEQWFSPPSRCFALSKTLPHRLAQQAASKALEQAMQWGSFGESANCQSRTERHARPTA